MSSIVRGARWVARGLACVLVASLVSLSLVRGAAAQAAPDYTINAGDQLDVSVWKEPDLTRPVIVRPDGKFSFPLAGEINAAGRTVVQIQNDLVAKLKTYIPEPVVTASVKSLDGYRGYVDGKCKRKWAITVIKLHNEIN
jgi:polysaccharide export outer membrane protein